MAGCWERARVFLVSGLACFMGVLTPPAAAYEAEKLVPVGHTVGMKLFAEGVIVVGLSEVETCGGKVAPAAASGLRVGDVIEEANGKEVDSSEQFAALLQNGGPLELAVCREGKELTLSAVPALGTDGSYRLGAWVRDSMAGIGTITFYDPATGVFGALGHGITDGDTGLLMPLGDGSIMSSTVKAVKQGGPGEPGELKGNFDLVNDLGTLYANTERGVFGTMGEGLSLGEAVPVAAPGDIHTGEAEILANVQGDQVARYSIQIVRILDTDGVQNLLLQVTDEDLIAATGGIVQGMSGSPILQDGKLVGAVTHVLLNDSKKGYGILIENMLSAWEPPL